MRKCTLNEALTALAVMALVTGCSGRRVNGDTPATATSPVESSEQKIENLTTALSRAQTRIEEMDAKLSAITDKVESTRIAVDNLTGSKPVKTEVVGSAREQAAPEENATAARPHEDAVPVKRLSAAEAKILLQQDSAITDFNKAMKVFKSGKYTDSELAFNHFTETYPEHVLAGSAQFYAGESYFLMGEYKLALNEYGKVISSFASSPRVASAMVRLSQCYEATGAANEAARTMALAHELYEGNPSLDWSGPAGRASSHSAEKVNKLKADLNASPIEPAEKSDESEHEKKD